VNSRHCSSSNIATSTNLESLAAFSFPQPSHYGVFFPFQIVTPTRLSFGPDMAGDTAFIGEVRHIGKNSTLPIVPSPLAGEGDAGISASAGG
jgi:hypothetical protein